MEDYVNSGVFILPRSPFIYDPKYHNSFCEQGGRDGWSPVTHDTCLRRSLRQGLFSTNAKGNSFQLFTEIKRRMEPRQSRPGFKLTSYFWRIAWEEIFRNKQKVREVGDNPLPPDSSPSNQYKRVNLPWHEEKPAIKRFNQTNPKQKCSFRGYRYGRGPY